MRKITFSLDKSMRLNNVIGFEAQVDNPKFDMEMMLLKMQSYVKTRGTNQVGPLVQHMRLNATEQGTIRVQEEFLFQCSDFISNPEPPFYSKESIAVRNAMYSRFVGPQEKLKFAFDKIYLEAFEDDIELNGENYVVFVNNDDPDHRMIDVFVPKREAE